MGSLRMWLLLVAGQIVTLILLALAGPVTAATPALRYLGYVCMAGIFASVPPLVLKLFLAGQTRIGNATHPLVRGLEQHEVAVVFVVWAMIGAALLMALPRIRSDIRAEQAAAAAGAGLNDTSSRAADASPTILPQDPPNALEPVTTPTPGSPERTAILDALRQRVKTPNRFRLDHFRMVPGFAFVRATEVVALDDGEEQETDLTVMALLELPPDSPTGWWRIVDYWTLPEEETRPLTNFLRHLREQQRLQRLPRELFPEDLWQQ